MFPLSWRALSSTEMIGYHHLPSHVVESESLAKQRETRNEDEKEEKGEENVCVWAMSRTV